MTDQPTTGTPSGPGASPGGNTGAVSPPSEMNGPSSFVRSRVGQMMAQQAQQPASGEPPAADARQQQQQPQSPPGERMIRVGETDYAEQALNDIIARDAEATSRKATLPSSADGYEIKLPDDWVGPEGVKFEFDKANPAWKAVREIAAKHGISQQAVSELAGAYASTQIAEAQRNATLRDVNMKQLGVAGPQRVEAVATWLQARAGAEGKATANFLRQFPSAPIVKTMENLMRQFSNQGGADFSQSHRDQAEDQGRIPGYDNLTFVQKRAIQMQQMLNRPGYRGGGGRRGE